MARKLSQETEDERETMICSRLNENLILVFSRYLFWKVFQFNIIFK